jgi:hypothetical protein
MTLFAPTHLIAAETQAAERPFSSVEVRTTSATSPVAGYGVFTPGAQPFAMDGIVATADKTVKLRMNRDRIVTGDGFSLGTSVFQNDSQFATISITIKNPAGESAVAIFRANKQTGLVERFGVERLRAIAGASGDLTLLRSVVPGLQPSTGRTLQPNDACTSSMIAVMGAALSMIGVCGEVEVTGDILGCMGAIVALAGALGSAYDNCGAPNLCGSGGCPDVGEPPCTSMTIC